MQKYIGLALPLNSEWEKYR